MNLLVVIPAFNEERHLPELLHRLQRVIPLDQVLVVDDGSRDRTALLAEAAGARVLRNPRNQGKGYSLYRGFQYALQEGYDAVLTLDADLQHPPEYLPAFLARAREGYHVVVGSRFHDMRGMPLDRYLTNKTTTLVLSVLTGQRLQDTQSGYRLIRREVLERFQPTTFRFDFESELLFQAALQGFRIGYVPIPTIYGQERSSIHKVRDTWRFIRLSLKLLAWR